MLVGLLTCVLLAGLRLALAAPENESPPQAKLLEKATTGKPMVGVGVNSEAGVVGTIALDEQKAEQKAPAKTEEPKEEQAAVALKIAVQAVNAGTGKPLADVPIEARTSNTKTRKSDTNSKRTDAEGNATLEIRGDLAEMGDLSLEARPAGYVPQYYRWKPDTDPASIPSQLTMRFQKGITIGGQIQDSSGNPIAGAKVELLMRATSASGGGLSFHLDTLTSDEQGHWRCDVAPEDLSCVELALSIPISLGAGRSQLRP